MTLLDTPTRAFSSTRTRLGAFAALSLLIASGCIIQQDADDDGSAGAGGAVAAGGSGATGGSGGAAPADPTQLFVVNNNAELTSYVGATNLAGEVAYTTRVNLGANTSLFQPRDAVLLPSGRLLVARQNGGIVGYDDGLKADGDTAASIVVEGDNTDLTTPVTMAYAAESDSLYVGAPQMENGVVAFTGVSDGDFNGDVMPARAFGPADRAPHDIDGTIQMSVDAIVLDSTGSLFLSDTSGDNVNNSRVLFYDAPAALDGMADPDAVITSTAWGQIEDIAIDAAGTLYVVDSTDQIFVYDNADQLMGEVQPSRTISVNVSLIQITGIELSSTGLGYIADDTNHSIHTLEGVSALDGTVDPNRTMEGFETRLRNPRKMFLLEP